MGAGDVFDAYSPPGGGYSLLAWKADSCARRAQCPIVITNASTQARVVVRSPLRYGFTYGGPFARGAFSPNGAHLAGFVNVANPFDGSRRPGLSALAIARTTTRHLPGVPAAPRVTTGDSGLAPLVPARTSRIAA